MRSNLVFRGSLRRISRGKTEELMKEMPKYKIIENYIIDRIQSGDLKPGDQIETEKQLSEKFDIGRLTVNKALINLAQEGYIERTAGKGSFVLPRMMN